MARPEPFVHITPDEQLDDLRRRLRATRWNDAPEDAVWSIGADSGYLRELVDYWVDEFDWRQRELELNALPRFRASLDGLGIHFVHARAVEGSPAPVPLILTHGWPDSFWRYAKVLALLTDPASHGGDPADAFDVVVPDLPGFGYSDRPRIPALNAAEVAALWSRLMTALGYPRYGAVGGDIGSSVSRFLALDFPEQVVAVHRMDAGLPAGTAELGDLSEDERRWIKEATRWVGAEGAYAAMHRTKPQTAAVGLTDSPAGLAAWIVEKMRAWSDCGGDVESVFSKDDLLTNVTVYWMTATISSSMRMYRANAAIPVEQYARRVEVPTGYSLFRGDIVRPPHAWLHRTSNAVYITEPPRGGHFAPYEQPELYAEELRNFFRPYRNHT
ncbi:epoxide hydrolase family protein [Mycolicibacterium smegmatis]|uniref:Epoxide hydrolase 1 n=3 Tax=Mycolicibacterium smegmatis TaxID=1772 RepID=A0QNW0_MYCS2|nr:epoxide hydrolase family protein [Mycolicibacterium smegmatis]ABK72822.1 epoxide hydrolase 1 [Mycolicibacterium smegmatis MC2 155]AFP36659.1 Epoxide hydrolase [Mycolicibacterium smegmatis MC2 155]AIU05463.1 multidrug MFS transporter [Mycolicibacterium smegmatis MC2 155]AIU12088.1 multidrug MFS transporter [Mycolicibacterium smegmatis]AIU18712.1 multidrug MFS transporter [Mycolicibacterium smegmatis]